MSTESRKWLLFAIALIVGVTAFQVTESLVLGIESATIDGGLGLDFSKIIQALVGVSAISALISIGVGVYFALDTWRGRRWIRIFGLIGVMYFAYNLYELLLAEERIARHWPTVCSFFAMLLYCVVIFISPAKKVFKDAT